MDHFRETYPLKVASILVHINKGCTCKISLLNPFPTAVSIKQDTVVGKAEPLVGKPRILFEKETEDEEENYSKVRRIALEPKTKHVKSRLRSRHSKRGENRTGL